MLAGRNENGYDPVVHGVTMMSFTYALRSPAYVTEDDSDRLEWTPFGHILVTLTGNRYTLRYQRTGRLFLLSTLCRVLAEAVAR